MNVSKLEKHFLLVTIKDKFESRDITKHKLTKLLRVNFVKIWRKDSKITRRILRNTSL